MHGLVVGDRHFGSEHVHAQLGIEVPEPEEAGGVGQLLGANRVGAGHDRGVAGTGERPPEGDVTQREPTRILEPLARHHRGRARHGVIGAQTGLQVGEGRHHLERGTRGVAVEESSVVASRSRWTVGHGQDLTGTDPDRHQCHRLTRDGKGGISGQLHRRIQGHGHVGAGPTGVVLQRGDGGGSVGADGLDPHAGLTGELSVAGQLHTRQPGEIPFDHLALRRRHDLGSGRTNGSQDTFGVAGG